MYIHTYLLQLASGWGFHAVYTTYNESLGFFLAIYTYIYPSMSHWVVSFNGSPKLHTQILTWVVGMGINAKFDCQPDIHHFDVNAMP